MYKVEYSPPLPLGESIKLVGKKNTSGEEGKGSEVKWSEEGKREGKKEGKKEGDAKGKAREKGREWEKEKGKVKGRLGLIFFPRERFDFGEENQLGKKGTEKGREKEREKGRERG